MYQSLKDPRENIHNSKPDESQIEDMTCIAFNPC
jgi:hypothetical protein